MIRFKWFNLNVKGMFNPPPHPTPPHPHIEKFAQLRGCSFGCFEHNVAVKGDMGSPMHQNVESTVDGSRHPPCELVDILWAPWLLDGSHRPCEVVDVCDLWAPPCLVIVGCHHPCDGESDVNSEHHCAYIGDPNVTQSERPPQDGTTVLHEID